VVPYIQIKGNHLLSIPGNGMHVLLLAKKKQLPEISEATNLFLK
jgi:hypothetical protein